MKCSWEVCIFPRVFHNNSLCKTWGANRVHYGDLENRELKHIYSWCILYFFDNTVLNIYFMHSRPFCCHLLTALLNSVYVVNEDSSIKVKRWLRLHGVSLLIVSITKFSIVIGSPRAYLSRNRRVVTWVSDYRCPI